MTISAMIFVQLGGILMVLQAVGVVTVEFATPIGESPPAGYPPAPY